VTILFILFIAVILLLLHVVPLFVLFAIAACNRIFVFVYNCFVVFAYNCFITFVFNCFVSRVDNCNRLAHDAQLYHHAYDAPLKRNQHNDIIKRYGDTKRKICRSAAYSERITG
jgi:hypothetical protein